MRTIYSFLFFLFFVLCGNTAIFSQTGLGTWEASAFLGLSTYQGDMTVSNLPIAKHGHFAFGFGARNFLSPQFAVAARFWHGKISGDDSLYPDLDSRGGKMTTGINSILLLAEFSPLGLAGDPNTELLFSPYLFFGTGVALANISVNYADIHGKPENIEQDKMSARNKFHVLFPFGVGLRFAPKASWNLSLEMGLATPFSDTIDGISMLGNPDKKDWITSILLGFHMPFGSERVVRPDSDEDEYKSGGF